MARIAISVDHKWRDLPGYVYLGLQLQRRGHEVVFLRNGLEKHCLPGIRPDAAVMPNLFHDEKRRLAAQWRQLGIRIVLLPTEGIPTLSGYRRFAAGVDTDLSCVDLHFAWNEPMRDLTLENPTVEGSRVQVVGVPRFDYYRQPLRSLLATREQMCKRYGLNPRWPIVTVATNFTQAQFATQNQDFFRSDGERLGFRKVYAEMEGDPDSIPIRDAQSRQLVVEALLRLLRDLPRTNFLLKLHPSEDHQYYRAALGAASGVDRRRVRIVAREYIWDVLNATDVELKRSCTTGIEAWLLDKPTLELQLNPEEFYFSEEHASGSDVVRSYEQLLGMLEHYLGGGELTPGLTAAREEFVARWCWHVDGNATRRVADGLHQLVSGVSRSAKPDLRSAAKYRLIRAMDWLVHDVKVYGPAGRLRGTFIDHLGRTDKQFHDSDVAAWNERLRELVA